LYDKYYRPELIAEVLASGHADAEVAERTGTRGVPVEKSLEGVPNVEIALRTGGSLGSDEEVVEVEVTDTGGGIDEVRLFHNDARIPDDTAGTKGAQSRDAATVTKTYHVTLVPGKNVFRATAFNRQRTESIPKEAVVKLDAAEASSSLYILAIGINKYKNDIYHLDWARPDAEAFAAALENRGKSIFKQITNVGGGFYDERATRGNIEATRRTSSCFITRATAS
jgi:hypothetical protein